ncbi:metal transporter uex isoform X2 [Leptinotarsa decemlineata]|uniref:metal transporter uex isoform X2 n=1 Tax=Leptinotarsa decemlineata TaxID=7539 RepID=UPI003D30B1EE
MARYLSRHAEEILYFVLVLFVAPFCTAFVDEYAPVFNSIEVKPPVEHEDYKTIVFEVRGRNIHNGIQVKATKSEFERGAECQDLNQFNYHISEIRTLEYKWGKYELRVPKDVQGNIYLCLPRKVEKDSGLVPSLFSSVYKWYSQGPNVTIDVPYTNLTGRGLSLQRRDLESRNTSNPLETIRITGIRLEKAHKDPDFDENGVPILMADAEHVIRIFGTGLTPSMVITFTASPENCLLPVRNIFHVDNASFTNTTVRVAITLPPITGDDETYYICAKDEDSGPEKVFILQGTSVWLQIKTYEKMLPLWASICVIVFCLSFSSLFSGLNLGLMSMDKTDLKILCNTGSSKERKYAQVIQPVRAHGNYLLCSILLGNVFVNSIFTILLDDLTSGLIAVIFSTLAIVMIGEIMPQAVCSRHGLAIGAKTIYITKFVMILTFPLSYPIAKSLDFLLGEEIGNVYTRERLKELVKVTTGENDLDKDEVNIISGALELRKKTVSEVMTKIEDVFMLDYEAVLDFDTVSEIMKSGFSRIPVFEGNRQNIVTMLYIKDLAFVDPDDHTPLKTLCQFYQNPCNFVFEDVTLDVMFKIFKEGNKGHMAFVHRVNNEGEGDPFYETIGLITLEDVIEELIQAEIMDETDVFTDNRSKRKRHAERRQDFTVFAEKQREPSKMMRISPQLTLAAYQYLSTSVEPFHPNVISETILRRLLKQDIVVHIKKSKEWRTDPANVIYDQGKAVDFFVIILEGRVEVTVGKENLMFEGGPFTYFGTQALVQTVGIESPSVAPSTMGSLESLNIDSLLRHTFIPDYSVRATTEVLYLKVKRSLYLAAKRATLMERSKRGENQTEQQFDEEVDKLLHSLDEDDALSTGRQTPRRKSSRKSQEIKENASLQTSPKTPSHYSAASPPHRLSPRDINGSLKSSPVDDIQVVGGAKDEEISLLPKRS